MYIYLEIKKDSQLLPKNCCCFVWKDMEKWIQLKLKTYYLQNFNAWVYFNNF